MTVIAISNTKGTYRHLEWQPQTDWHLALTITNILRTKGVVGKFVEFFGPGVAKMSVADRATNREHGSRIWGYDGLLPSR